MSHCFFFFSSSLFFYAKKNARDIEEKKQEDETQAVRPNVLTGIKTTQCLLHTHTTIQSNREGRR